MRKLSRQTASFILLIGLFLQNCSPNQSIEQVQKSREAAVIDKEEKSDRQEQEETLALVEAKGEEHIDAVPPEHQETSSSTYDATNLMPSNKPKDLIGEPSAKSQEFIKRGSQILNQDTNETSPLLPKYSKKLLSIKKETIQEDDNPSSNPSSFRDIHLSQAMQDSPFGETDYDEDPDFHRAYARLKIAEKRPFSLKWIYMDHLIEKMAYASLLRKSNVFGEVATGCRKVDPLWIEGRGIPLRTGYSTARAISGFRQGVEFVLKRSLSLTLQGLLIYQIGSQIFQHKGFQPLPVLNILWNGDEQSIRGVLAVIVQDPGRAPYFFSLFAAPFLWGSVKAVLFAKRSIQDSPKNFKRAVKIVEDFSKSSLNGIHKRLWKDNLRWFFPLHPIGREVNYLVYKLLLDGKLTLDERAQAFEALLDFARNTQGWSKIAGLVALQKVAAGTALKQLPRVEKAFGKDYKEALLQEKVRAFLELYSQNPGVRKASIRGLIHNLYANYYRWTLGDFDGWKSAVAWAIFKSGVVGLQINLFVKIAEQVIKYLKCPKPLQQGFNYAMQPAGYSFYDQKCFNAYLSVFNKVPGQPTCTIVNLLPRFKLDPTYMVFNLSGAKATGEQIASILYGLHQYQPTIHFTEFDLSYNAINTKSGMSALFEALKTITKTNTPENGIKTLNLSRNIIGVSDDAATLVLGHELKYFPNLQTLDLTSNQIGNTAENGTIAIGESLKYLTNLQSLGLAFNQVGYTGEDGTIAIGEGLKYLPNLQTLDLSENAIGRTRDNGTVALGEGLKCLTNLQTLNLSWNGIGLKGDNGTIVLGESLKYLTNLQTLNLLWNAIGLTGDNGITGIGEGLKHLTSLQTLDLSINRIASGFSNLVSSITQLKTLKNLFIQQGNGITIPPSQLTLLQKFWNHRNNNTDIYALITSQDVQTYLDSLPNDTKTISLSRNFPNPSAELITLFFKGMTRFHNLQALDLSKNEIGVTGEDGPIAIGDGLKYLPNLQTLDLSQNEIGRRGEDGPIAIGEGLKYLPNLQTLDLSGTWIGDTGDQGPIALGEGLKYLSNLQNLDLSGNEIGYRGDNGTIAIGDGLKYLPNLQTLDLSQNEIGYKGDNGTIAIGKGLKYLPYLQALDLSLNHIGSTGDNGTIAIGEGLKYLPNLQILDLSGNEIGGSGAQSLFNDLPRAICHGLKMLNLQVNNFTDIPWSQAAKALERLYSVEIRQACEANRCFGTPIAINTTAIKCGVIQSGSPYDECPPLTSSASSLSPFPIFKFFNFFKRNERPALTYPVLSEEVPIGTALVPYQPVQPPSCWESLQDRFGWRSCHTQAKGAFSPSSTNLFLTGALKGAASTFVLEMMRDGLERKQVSRHVSHKALMLTQAGLVIYTTTSLIPTMVGMAINSGLTSIGVSSPISAAIGSTVAIATSLINGDVVTPIGLAASLAGGLAGSMLALRVKNKIASWLWGNETGSQVSINIGAFDGGVARH